eukprot:COSAG04_NODE_2387_length_4228_cov_1.352386_9_plen_87_part_00
MRGWLLEALLSLVESSAGQLMHARTAEELAEEEQAWQARLAVEFGAAGDAVRAESVSSSRHCHFLMRQTTIMMKVPRQVQDKHKEC